MDCLNYRSCFPLTALSEYPLDLLRQAGVYAVPSPDCGSPPREPSPGALHRDGGRTRVVHGGNEAEEVQAEDQAQEQEADQEDAARRVPGE